ncbi:MAG: methylenetetrahydrofolate reductase C-terminal domain-containing protein [Candidatus Omnitrophota bacterium]
MKMITKQKEFAEIEKQIKNAKKIYLIGCGTCATMCETGGKNEVLQMKKKLENIGKEITGWMVIPTACDILTKEAIKQEKRPIKESDLVMVMTCGFGVQRVADHVDKLVFPALDTLFIGKEDEEEREFIQVCAQCGECVLGTTAGICPIVSCHKGLLNGPCGGTDKGKCEVDKEKDCAWVLIYNRLKKLDRLDLMEKRQVPKNYQKVVKPGKIRVKE